ncbi:MAG: hypothetical protein M5U15_11955 [Kiritimatiellae bacterium]|nr:hypothetical protein [Kiritimatiellia bacterium]
MDRVTVACLAAPFNGLPCGADNAWLTNETVTDHRHTAPTVLTTSL